MTITIQDIDAATQVVAELAEAADSLHFEEAVAFKAALGRLKAATDAAISLVRGEAIKALNDTPEKAAVLDGVVYRVKPTGKWRPDQQAIRRVVAARAACDDEGELRSPSEAAGVAVDMMYRLFVAPQTFPKTGGLDELKLAKADVGTWEQTGTELAENTLK